MRFVNSTVSIFSVFCLLVPLRSEAGTQADSGGQTVGVRGAVKASGAIRWHDGMRLFHAIRSAGGFSESADVRQITLTRENKVTTHNLRIVGSSSDNPVLKAGDQIFVPSERNPGRQKQSKPGVRH